MDLQEVTVFYDGQEYKLVLDTQTWQELSSDQSKLQSYCSHLFGGTSGTSRPEEVPAVTTATTSGDTTASTSGDTTASTSGDTTLEANVSSTFRWTRESTKMLIVLRLEREREFNRPTCKKRKLWASIAREISSVLNSTVSADACDLKFRNLLATYKKNKQRAQKSGEGAITWEHFEEFDVALGTKASISPSEEVLGAVDTIEDASEIENLTRATLSQATSLAVPSPVSPASTPRARQRGITLNEYLLEKLKKDEEKRISAERRWEEKKELKEREIQAIQALADAIAGRK